MLISLCLSVYRALRCFRRFYCRQQGVKLTKLRCGNKMENTDTEHDYFKPKVNGNGKRIYPIVYDEKYDIKLFGLEYLHPFDTHKWHKTYQLIKDNFENEFSSLSPLQEVSQDVLLLYHSEKYVKDIHESNAKIARVAESFFIYWLPNSVIRSRILQSFKWHTSGTILACRLAMLHGAAVNLGGGFHHASRAESSGFCFFADIQIAIEYLWKNVNEDLKFFIIDLDAHQGNGHELAKRPLGRRKGGQILIFDMYNKDVFPQDGDAKQFIDFKLEITSETSNDQYLDKLNKTIEKNSKKIVEFNPNLVIYNAGTDVLKGDPLGRLNVTEQGIIDRDEVIFKFCVSNGFPVVYLMSGGYQLSNSKIVADSIINLVKLQLIKPISQEIRSLIIQ